MLLEVEKGIKGQQPRMIDEQAGRGDADNYDSEDYTEPSQLSLGGHWNIVLLKKIETSGYLLSINCIVVQVNLVSEKKTSHY